MKSSKNLVFFVLLSTLAATTALAESYECFVPLLTASLRVDQLAKDGTLTLIKTQSVDAPTVIGTVVEVVSLDGDNKQQKAAFDFNLDFIRNANAAGIPADQLVRVKTIQAIQTQSEEFDEVNIFRLFDKDKKQIGGTVSISGHIVEACLPK